MKSESLSIVLPDDRVEKITRPCRFCTCKYERTSGFFGLWKGENAGLQPVFSAFPILFFFLNFLLRVVLLKSSKAKRGTDFGYKLMHQFLTFQRPFLKQALFFMCLRFKSFENTMGKEEIAGIKRFLLFLRCFLPI